MDFDATPVPADVVAALGLTQGTRYSGQNVSGTATLFVREAASAPAVTDRAFRVDGPVWLWTDEADGCAVIIAEAA